MSELVNMQPKSQREDGFQEDIERMKAALNAAGYDAPEATIEWAWERWSDDCRASGWYSINGLPDEFVVERLLSMLEPDEHQVNE